MQIKPENYTITLNSKEFRALQAIASVPNNHQPKFMELLPATYRDLETEEQIFSLIRQILSQT